MGGRAGILGSLGAIRRVFDMVDLRMSSDALNGGHVLEEVQVRHENSSCVVSAPSGGGGP